MTRLVPVVGVVVLLGACGAGTGPSNATFPAAVEVELSAACSAALEPARTTMAANEGGVLTSDLRALLVADLDPAYEVCTQSEYLTFAASELDPWGKRLRIED